MMIVKVPRPKAGHVLGPDMDDYYDRVELPDGTLAWVDEERRTAYRWIVAEDYGGNEWGARRGADQSAAGILTGHHQGLAFRVGYRDPVARVVYCDRDARKEGIAQ